VTNSGSVVADWRRRADDAAGWYLDDNNSDKDVVGTDTATLCAIITATSDDPSDIDEGDFGDEDLLNNTRTLTDCDMDGNQYSSDGSGVDGDSVGSGEQRRLWIRLKTPSNTTTIDAQQFRLYIEALASNTF
jgi:hypothetical protein